MMQQVEEERVCITDNISRSLSILHVHTKDNLDGKKKLKTLAPEVSHDEQSEDNVIHASVPLELSSKSPS